jgi:hypothetical protein
MAAICLVRAALGRSGMNAPPWRHKSDSATVEGHATFHFFFIL